ncbi:MAG: sodium:alanine symporter family protein [Nitrospinota bacterium]|nr:sodium:alanine symporter family protein [Nitrospinota bacterium]
MDENAEAGGFLIQLQGTLDATSSFLWGPPLIVLILGVGLYLTFLLRGIQFTFLGQALYMGLVKRTERDGDGDISHFQALMTALSATVGTGNIVGVATAIMLGGPGAVFWMWMTGLVGMATKFSEAVLAVKYRYKDEKGNMLGGPMTYIAAIGPHPVWSWMAMAFALFAAIASFGIGNMVQAHSVADTLDGAFGLPRVWTGVGMAALTAMVILGGIKSIGRVTSAIVPVMIFIYVGAALYILVSMVDGIPAVIGLIFESAFTPAAGAGGFAWAALRWGVARGIFSNESGLGSSPIAAAAAKTNEPVAQALVSMTQTFIDTLVVCTMTAFVILLTGAHLNGLEGGQVTTSAFSAALGADMGEGLVAVALAFFAYSTVLGWSYYGERATESLVGLWGVLPYRLVYCALVYVGANLDLSVVWAFCDITNALMALPNLVALVMLSPVVRAETVRYIKGKKWTQ